MRAIGLYAHYGAKPWGGYVPDRGIWISSGEEPVIRWYDLDGTPIARWEVDLPNRAITAAERDAVADNLRLAVEEALHPAPGQEVVNPEIAKARARFPLFADYKAFWAIPFVDDRGFLWVMEGPPFVAPSQPRPESVQMLIMSPSGEFLGRTTLPEPGLPSKGHLLAVGIDPESLEPTVRAYRIHSAIDGLDY